jgi:hypothetical protein
MISKTLPMAALLCLTACGKAEAVTVDSANPAHCIAAFEIGVAAARQSKDLEWAAQDRARSLYEAGKLRNANAALVKSEVDTVILQIREDLDAAGALYKRCSLRQNEDRGFASQSEALLALAKQMSPLLP